jgi:hypothetical protein
MDTPIVEGIPKLPDLTHPAELLALGQTSLWYLALALGFVFCIGGLLLALLRWRFASQNPDENPISPWIVSYERGVKGLYTVFLSALLVAGSYFVTATLANRTHHWEFQQVAKQTQVVEGYRQEQPAPQIYYYKPETYIVQALREGQLKDLEKTRYIRYTLNLASSQIQVKITQIQDNSEPPKHKYKVQFEGNYTFANTVNGIHKFRFLAEKPQNYELLEGFKVFKDGQELQALVQETNQFGFDLPPGQQTQFKIQYQSQGDARWVYNAYNTLLSNFKLQLEAPFPNAQYASGILPQQTQEQGAGKVFVWEFKDNVSVLNPFGVFTSSGAVPKTGIISRILLLAPGVLVWWLFLLLLTQRPSERSPAWLGSHELFLIAALFLSGILALTYSSRLLPAWQAWIGISFLLLALSAGLRQNPAERGQAALATLLGFVLPVSALLSPYTGLTLAVTALAAVIALLVHYQTQLASAQPFETT